MFKLVYTNSRGQSVEMYGAPYQLFKVEGLGDVGVVNHTQQAPYQDGSTYIDSYLTERYINIELTIRAEDSQSLSRQRSFFSSVFNPKMGMGTLKYINGDIEKEIKAVPDGMPYYPDGSGNRTKNIQKVALTLTCPNPYWYDSDESAIQLVTFSGGLEFPLTLPTYFGNQNTADKSKVINNSGDSETPLEIEFSGPATSPIRIVNETTGKFIEVAQDLLEGERLIINTAFGNKSVTKVKADGTRINAFNYIKIDVDPAKSSTFFQLETGNNLLSYSTGTDFDRAPVTIKFNPRFFAV